MAFLFFKFVFRKANTVERGAFHEKVFSRKTIFDEANGSTNISPVGKGSIIIRTQTLNSHCSHGKGSRFQMHSVAPWFSSAYNVAISDTAPQGVIAL